ncbi:hypothetical protein RvY_13766 [Ramazzottius varieornatus]|uniref:Uncharacterized protein n=1 Tax=Ramazzottius varieornatus TaxID=947166 RepID=A0A1D1VWG1_RAMVA|nr:hypothetical protein RvY_13766 [Ramazzottius varieornatus]
MRIWLPGSLRHFLRPLSKPSRIAERLDCSKNPPALKFFIETFGLSLCCRSCPEFGVWFSGPSRCIEIAPQHLFSDRRRYARVHEGFKYEYSNFSAQDEAGTTDWDRHRSSGGFLNMDR